MSKQIEEDLEQLLVESIKDHLLDQGFKVTPIESVDIIATKGAEHFLIEFKAPTQGYVTVDAIAQVLSRAKECEDKLGKKVKPIVIGNFTAAGSTQTVAALNKVHLVNIPPRISADRLNLLVDEELGKIITDVS